MTNQLVAEDLVGSVSSLELRAIFEKIAPVVSVQVLCDPVTSRSFGTALVTFESVNDRGVAQKELEGQKAGGAPVALKMAEAEDVKLFHTK